MRSRRSKAASSDSEAVDREGTRGGQARSRCADRRAAGDRPLHDPAEAQLSRTPSCSSNLSDIVVRRGGARSDRGLWRCERLGDGEPGRHGSVPAEGVAPRTEDRARSEPRVSAKCAIPSRAIPPTRRSWRSSRASGFRWSAGSRSTSSRRATRDCCRSSSANLTMSPCRSTWCGTCSIRLRR